MDSLKKTYSKAASNLILRTRKVTLRFRHGTVGVECFFLNFFAATLNEKKEAKGVATKMIGKLGITFKNARTIAKDVDYGEPISRVAAFFGLVDADWDIEVTDAVSRATEIAATEGHPKTCTDHILKALLETDKLMDENWLDFLEQLNVSANHLTKKFKAVRERRVLTKERSKGLNKEENQERDQDDEKGFKKGKHPEYGLSDIFVVSTFLPPERARGVLLQYGEDLTRQARGNRIDPVIGRDTEVVRVTQILGRRRKNNPILLGEPGVGKTAVAEGLAQLIVRGKAPTSLAGKTLVSIELGSLVAGTRYRGEFERRLRRIVDTVKRMKGRAIVLIDEIHTLIGAGSAQGTVDGSNILKPDLARGTLRCIGATTRTEYRKYILRDTALERRFQPITVEQPTIEDVIKILQGLCERYEAYHKVTFDDKSLVAAATLSDRYIADRFLPDKAIDLIDEAGSRAGVGKSRVNDDLQELVDNLWEVKEIRARAIRKQDYEVAQKTLYYTNVLQEDLKNTLAEEKVEINPFVLRKRTLLK